MLLNGRYHITKALKSNGSGNTFLAEDTQVPDRGHLAIKQFSLASTDPGQQKLWRDLVYEQLDTLAGCAQNLGWFPNLVDGFEDGGRFYLVREWVPGIPLSSGSSTGNGLNQDDITELLLSTLDNLCDLHEMGQIHGNLKPSNIIVRQPDGEPVLVDFNLMAAAPAPAPSLRPGTQATIQAVSAFAPPEQQIGNLCYASDLYSLTLSIIYLLTGKLPHQLDRDRQTGQILWRHYAPELNPDLADVLDTAIQLRPEDRYVTAMEMLEDLQAIAPAPGGFPSLRFPTLAGIGNSLLLRRGLVLAGAAAILIIAGMGIKQLTQALIRVPSSSTSSAATPFPTNPDSNPLATQPPSTGESPPATTSPTPAPTPQVPAITGDINEQTAAQLITLWLQAKQQIFAPPFDRTLVTAITTDPLSRDILSPDGPLDWLQSNNARYQFRSSQVEALELLEQEGDRALVEATITEDRTLTVNGIVDASQSGLSTGRFRYLLQQVDGEWRIADYQGM
jgi:serine/threonine-protein kinase